MNIVENPKLHKELWARWKELELTSADVIKDAEERGVHILAPRLSRYKNMVKNENGKGSLTPNQLIWLSTRYGIYININIGSPQISEGKLKYIVEPYDELKCLLKLRQVFPDTKTTIGDISK